jgi:rhodanese-related sulfurtransferase
MRTITASDLYTHLQSASPVLLDVREPAEYEICHIPNSTLIPMGEITSRIQELDEDDEIVCICHHGMRSMQVAMYLENQGFHNVVNLTGGVDAWSNDVDASMPRY